MGLLDKFKNLFTEEVEDDVIEQVIEPDKLKKETTINEEKTVNIKKNLDISIDSTPSVATIKKEEPVTIKSETVVPKKEEKFVFPVYFDDKDLADIGKKEELSVKKPVPTINLRKEQQNMEPRKEIYRETYNTKKVQETPSKKIFKPTPIISPVYGILDKNYYKEDIVVSNSSRDSYYDSNKPVSVDDVRKKAFGTLEDDLEKNLFTSNDIENEVIDNKDETIFDESDFANAVEEDKKRDLTKDDLKADIEALLDNKEFAEEFKNNILKRLSSNDIAPKKEEDTISQDIEENTSEQVTDEDVSNLNGQDVISTLNNEDEVSELVNNEEISELSTDEVISNLINDDETVSKIEVKKSKSSKSKTNNTKKEEPKNLLDEELLLGGEEETTEKENIDIDLNSIEIDNAYSDENDLNESDLFNLIDSMYEKEDK